jgi:hypothetical protein
MGEPHTVRIALQMYEKAIALAPDNRSYAEGLERMRMIWESDYAR